MFEDNPLEGVGREMVPEGMLKETETESVAEAAPPAGHEAETLPLNLTPEEVIAQVGEGEALEEPPPVGEAAPEDKGLGAMEPMLPPEALGKAAAPEAEVPVPPPEAIRGAPLFTAAAFEAPGTMTPTPGPLPPEPLSPSDEMVKKLVPFRSVEALWKRADDLHQSVKEEISSLPLARQLLDQIQAARNYLMAGSEYYEEAERLLNEVDYRVALARRVREWSYTIGIRLLAYELIWVVVLAAGMFFLPWLVARVGPSLGYMPAAEGPQSVDWLVVALKSVIWGGLGGVTGALYALWRHVAREQDFDKQYTMWYITNPIMGLALGAFVYLVIQAGLFSLTAGSQQDITSAAMVFVLAWITGFQQNVAYDMVRRVLQLFRIEEKPSEAEAGPGPLGTSSRLR